VYSSRSSSNTYFVANISLFKLGFSNFTLLANALSIGLGHVVLKMLL
jgi:hypothetical protein